jgi:hypothetical protein
MASSAAVRSLPSMGGLFGRKTPAPCHFAGLTEQGMVAPQLLLAPFALAPGEIAHEVHGGHLFLSHYDRLWWLELGGQQVESSYSLSRSTTPRISACSKWAPWR